MTLLLTSLSVVVAVVVVTTTMAHLDADFASFLERRTRPLVHLLMRPLVHWEETDWLSRHWLEHDYVLNQAHTHLKRQAVSLLAPWTRAARSARRDACLVRRGEFTGNPLGLVYLHAGACVVVRALKDTHGATGEAASALYWSVRGVQWHRHIDPALMAAARLYRDSLPQLPYLSLDPDEDELGYLLKGRPELVASAVPLIVTLRDPVVAEAYVSLSADWSGDIESCVAVCARL